MGHGALTFYAVTLSRYQGQTLITPFGNTALQAPDLGKALPGQQIDTFPGLGSQITDYYYGGIFMFLQLGQPVFQLVHGNIDSISDVTHIKILLRTDIEHQGI